MKNILTTSKIYNDFISGNLSKKDVIDKLYILIENSDSVLIRVECLEIINEIAIKNETIFKILENFAISDTQYAVRADALRILRRLFPKKSIDILKWAFRNDKSYEMYKNTLVSASIYDSLYWSEENSLKDFRNELVRKLNPTVQKYVEDGVIQSEAPILAIFELQHCIKLLKVEDDNFRRVGSSGWLHYKINNKGHVTAIYIGQIVDFIPQHINILKSLEELVLVRGNIMHIPESIENLKSLKILNLYGNRLKNIPNYLGLLNSLQKLSLEYNQIRTIPDSIGLLNNLQELSLYENEIRTIPDSIANLTSLEILDLRFNNIKNVPNYLRAPNWFKKLKVEDSEFNNI